MGRHARSHLGKQIAIAVASVGAVATTAIVGLNLGADAQPMSATAADARIHPSRTPVPVTYTQKQVNDLIASAVAKQKAHDDAVIERLKTRIAKLMGRPQPTPTSGGTPSSPAPVTSPTSATGSTPTAPSTSNSTAIPASFAGYTRVLAQNFDVDAPVGSFADKYPGWAGYDGNVSGASGTQWNSKTTMSVKDSVLRMRNWVSNGKAQAGALTPLVGNAPWYQQAQTYGKYVVRFKAEPVHGFKVAWLLWPSSGDWGQGEIDFPEANLDGTVNWSTHNVTGDPEDQVWGATKTKMADGQWHIATTTWEPGKVIFELDGVTVKVVTDPKFVPTNPMRWDLQNETSTDGSRPSADADGSVYIDWVAQFRRDAAK